MNRIATNLTAAVIAVAVCFFLGRLFFLSGLQTQIYQANAQLEENKSRYEQIDADLQKLTATDQAGAAGKTTAAEKMLKPGDESTLLRLIGSTAGKSFRINSFDMIESFRFKPEMQEASAMPAAASFNPQQLPELDEQGMPVGSAAEDDEEWPGVEIVPARLTFSTTFRTLGKFLSDAAQTMPVNTVRSLDLILREEGLVKGTLVLNFPLADGK